MSIILCAALFFQLVRVVTKSASTDREIALLQEESTRLSAEYQRLEQLRTLFDTDFFAEREARTKLGYKKPGEQAVIVIEPEPADAVQGEKKQKFSAEIARSEESIQDTNPVRWWLFFFGRSNH